MQVKIFPTYYHLNHIDLTGKAVVVIDVLRATSTITTALANGAEEIIPTETPAECFRLTKSLPPDKILLGGEHHCRHITGFHLGNSPREYRRAVVRGKTIIFTSTNGAQTVKAASGAGMLLIGSLLNGKAVARQLKFLETDLVLACSGTRGDFSLEDTLGAGMIIYHLTKYPSFEKCILDDFSYFARHLFISNRRPLHRLLLRSRAGQTLTALGHKQDIRYCSQMNLHSVVPIYSKGAITLA